MSIWPGWLRATAKRSQVLVRLHAQWKWKLHVLKDWWGTKVWTKTTEVVTPLGFTLTSGFHPSYKSMRLGTFEVEETAVLARLLHKADLFVDIGANLGYYTCLALQNGTPVVAFEPQQQNLQCLFHNLLANGWQSEAEVFPLALGSQSGLLTLYGASGTSASLVRNWAGYSPRAKQIVPVSTLDSIIASRFVGKRLLIKMDVEGAEFHVLKGASATLTRTPRPTWLVEVCLHEFHPEGANPDFQRTFELFWDNGYVAFTATDNQRMVTPDEVYRWVERGRTDSETFNYLFVAAVGRGDMSGQRRH